MLAAPAQAAAPAAEGRLLVFFEKAVSKDRQQQLVAAADARIARRFAAVRGGSPRAGAPALR